MISCVPYDKKYLGDVIRCLKRNFGWMSERDDDEIREWLKPITEYSWSKMPCIKDNAYYGRVLLNDNDVIGYMGCICYTKDIDGEEISFCNLSTWGVDKEFRSSFIGTTSKMYECADVVIDLSPDQGSIGIGKRLFGMREFETLKYYAYPIPYFNEKKVLFSIVENDDTISDATLRREYLDHKDYIDVKLAYVEDEEKSGFIFFKEVDDGGRYIRILKVTDTNLFKKHFYEISWYLFESGIYSDKPKEEVIAEIIDGIKANKRMCLECDSRFIGGELPRHPNFIKIPVNRLIKYNRDDLRLKEIDLMYTEYATLI